MDLASILEGNIDQKLIKNSILFSIDFGTPIYCFWMDFHRIWEAFLKRFSITVSKQRFSNFSNPYDAKYI